jgi:hypothetical protein
MHPMIGTNIVMWIFLGGLIIAGYLHFAAARINAESTSRNQSSSSHFKASFSPSTGTIKQAQRDDNAIQALPLPALQKIEERVYVPPDVTPRFLSKLTEGQTTLQANRTVGAYIGKWMAVTGIVSNIMPGLPVDTNMIVTLDRASLGGTPVVLTFGKEWFDHLSVLRLGNGISAIGKINSIESTIMFLHECEIISA